MRYLQRFLRGWFGVAVSLMARIISWSRWRQGRHGLAAHLVCVVMLVAAGVRADQPGIHDMPRVQLQVAGEVFDARLADSAAHRAAGFQHAAPDVMNRTAIYFAYERPVEPVYHMRNVARPLLIAWVKPDGVVHEVARMQPGSRVYPAPVPVTAVLEFTSAHPLAGAVRPGVRVALAPEQR